MVGELQTVGDVGSLVFVPLEMLLKGGSYSLTVFFLMTGIVVSFYGIKIQAKAGAELRRLKAERRREKNYDIPTSDVQSDLRRNDSNRPS